MLNPLARGPHPPGSQNAIPMGGAGRGGGMPESEGITSAIGATANPNTLVTNATPIADMALRPVDVGSRKPWAMILATFNIAAGRPDTLSVRAPGTGLDMNRRLGVGYFNAQGQAQRGTSAQKYAQGKRSQMAPLPTPQSLLRQVTGIGDPVQGR